MRAVRKVVNGGRGKRGDKQMVRMGAKSNARQCTPGVLNYAQSLTSLPYAYLEYSGRHYAQPLAVS